MYARPAQCHVSIDASIITNDTMTYIVITPRIHAIRLLNVFMLQLCFVKDVQHPIVIHLTNNSGLSFSRCEHRYNRARELISFWFVCFVAWFKFHLFGGLVFKNPGTNRQRPGES